MISLQPVIGSIIPFNRLSTYKCIYYSLSNNNYYDSYNTFQIFNISTLCRRQSEYDGKKYLFERIIENLTNYS